MRPSLLDPLFAPATTLDGVGLKVSGLIANVLPFDTTGREVRVGDLLFILPNSMIDRRERYRIADAPENSIVTLDLVIDHHQPAPSSNRSAPYRVFAHDDSGEIALTFFRARGDWLTKALPEGAQMLVSGRLEWFNGRASMVHPDHMVPAD